MFQQNSRELQAFLDELEENLDFLDKSIIALEENPENKEILEEIFRVAHTLKGSAGFLDLKNMVSLGHVMESLFNSFYNGVLTPSRDVIDILFEAKDAFSAIGRALSEGTDSQAIKVDHLIARLESFLGDSGTGTERGEISAKVVSQSVKEAIPGTQLIRVWISREEVVPSLRAFLVRKKISDIATIVKSEPDESYLESDEFAAQKERIISFYVRCQLQQNEIIQLINVDLVDRIEVLTESEQKKAVEAAANRIRKDETENRADLTNTVRIPVKRLDTLLNLVGELVIANSGFTPVQEKLREIPAMETVYRSIRDRTRELYRISGDIQELVMKSRLVPIGTVFSRFNRFVRDYARRTGKEIQLGMEGESTEIDKKIVDEIIKPLTHLVRNSLDHGLEQPQERIDKGKDPLGKIMLRAFQEGNYVNIVVEDDGRGLNYQDILEKAVQKKLITEDEAAFATESDIRGYIFKPGFSTRDSVDELSGRGIGMDVVKNSVEMLNGTIDVTSFVDSGTKITIKLPLTLAILNALIVKVGEEQLIVPMSSIVETQKVTGEQLFTLEGNLMMNLRDTIITLIDVGRIFNFTRSELRVHKKKEYSIVLVEHMDAIIGLLVDGFISRQEMVIKSLTEHYRHIEGISGASIMGDGSIILIVDVHGIIQSFKEYGYTPTPEDFMSLVPDPDRNSWVFENERNEKIKLYGERPEQKADRIPAAVMIQEPEHPETEDTISEAPPIREIDLPSEQTPAFIHSDYSPAELTVLKSIIDGSDEEKLRSWVLLANQKSVAGLVQLTGTDSIRVGKCRVKKIQPEKAGKISETVTRDRAEYIDIHLPILPFQGNLHFLLKRGRAEDIVRRMWRAAGLSELSMSGETSLDPLLEVTNILGGAYTNSLTEISGIMIEPGLPAISESTDEFVNQIREISAAGGHILYVENLLFWEGQDVLAELLIVIPEIKI